MKQPWYRKNYLSAPSVQFKIIGLLGMVSTLAAGTICYIAFERIIVLKSFYYNQYRNVPPLKPVTFDILAESLMYRLIGCVGIMVIVFLLIGIALTHRLAGPIEKLKRELRKLHKGEEIAPIHFRKRDEFHDLPELINPLIEAYKKKS